MFRFFPLLLSLLNCSSSACSIFYIDEIFVFVAAVLFVLFVFLFFGLLVLLLRVFVVDTFFRLFLLVVLFPNRMPL